MPNAMTHSQEVLPAWLTRHQRKGRLGLRSSLIRLGGDEPSELINGKGKASWKCSDDVTAPTIDHALSDGHSLAWKPSLTPLVHSTQSGNHGSHPAFPKMERLGSLFRGARPIRSGRVLGPGFVASLTCGNIEGPRGLTPVCGRQPYPMSMLDFQSRMISSEKVYY